MLMAINVAVFIAQFLSKDRLLLWGAKVRSPLLRNRACHLYRALSSRWLGLTYSGEKWHTQLDNVRHCSTIVHTYFCCSNLRVFMPFHVGSLVRQQYYAQESSANQIAIGCAQDKQRSGQGSGGA